jgi:urease accessory protein
VFAQVNCSAHESFDMNKNHLKALIPLGLLALLPNVASAHILPGTAHGFQDGLAHPWTGWDHLLAMFAIGLWAAQHRGRAVWLIPLSFVAVMIGGGIAGVAGVYMPGTELVIAASVLVLGGLIATRTRLTPGWGMAVAGLFALFHGYAHGHEMPAAASAVWFSAGFVASTLALHGLGIAAGLGLRERPRAVRLAGAAIAVCAVCLIAG